MPCTAQDRLVADTYKELQAAQRAEASASKAQKSAAKKRRKEAEQAYKRALKAQKQCQKTARTAIRQEARTTRTVARQDARTERTVTRQDARTARTEARQQPENVAARQEALQTILGTAIETAGDVGEAYIAATVGPGGGAVSAPPVERPRDDGSADGGSAPVGGELSPVWIGGGVLAGLALVYLLTR